MKLSERKYFIPTVYIGLMIVSAIFVLMIDNLAYEDWLFTMGWFTIFHCLITMVCLYKAKIKLFSLSGFFIALTYLFHFGQIVIRAFTSNYHFPIVDYAMWLDSAWFAKTVIFSLFTISFVTLGVLLTTYIKFDKQVVISRETSKDYEKIGWLILLITLPLRIFIDVNGIITSLREGYLAVLDMNISGVVHQLASFYIIGIFYLLAAFKNDSKKANILLISTLVYNAITMLSGGRSRQIILILVIIYFYFTIVKKLTKKHIIIVGIMSSIGIILLNTITALRVDGIDSVTQFINTVVNNNNNPILAALEEFGSSIYTVYQTVVTVPDSKSFSYGKTYLYGFAPVLLNFKGILTNVVDASIVAKNINATAPLGGSYIAELYYNFGYVSYLMGMGVGFFIQIMTTKIEEYLRTGNYYRVSFYVMSFYNAIWWVRASFTDFTRAFVWGTIFIWGVHYYVMNYLKTEK